MSQLEDTTRRLGAAIARLESAAAERLLAPGEETPSLSSALAKAERENAGLRAEADAVSRRLDHAIDRLKSLLDA